MGKGVSIIGVSVEYCNSCLVKIGKVKRVIIVF